MSTFKMTDVVMLTTNQKAENCLAKYYNGKLSIVKSLLTQSYLKEARIKLFHLYFLSDEEIKASNYCICLKSCNFTDGTRHRVEQILFVTKETESYYQVCKNDYKKIIATTNSSLRINVDMFDDPNVESTLPFPQPSESFLEVFVKEYNKGNQIKKVMVEYEDDGEEGWIGSDADGEPTWIENWILKINPKDNTITIRKVKDSWSREEVIILLKEFRNGLLPVQDVEIKYTEKFIEQNL